MKKYLYLSILLIISFSCLDIRVGKLDNAKELYKEGKFEEALSQLKTIQSTKIDSISKEIIDFQSQIKDTIGKINFICTYDGMKLNRSDSAFMGFRLNSTKSEVMNNLRSLQRRDKIDDWQTHNFTINGLGGYTQDLELSGYELDFYPSDYKCTGLIKFNYFFNRLISIEITLFKYPDGVDSEKVLSDIELMYEKKYGLPKHQIFYYNSEELKYIKYFFREKNKAIYLNEGLGFVTIIYEDIVAKVDKDNLKKEIKKIDKGIKREHSEELQNEI